MVTRTLLHTSVHECSQTHSDISTCLHCLHGERGKKRKDIIKGNMSLLEWRAVNVVKTKKKKLHSKKTENVKNRHADPALKNSVIGF